ncbi:MAG: thioesterase [Fibrobacteraceae bacterium]|nr:thioesterase [Fibrobacteraceae bacterium]
MQQNQEPTRKNFTVRFSDCDPSSRMRISSFFDFMEETAILDAEENGFGIWKMVEMGYTFVVSRMKLRINHIPRWGEKLKVSTWTKSFYEHKVALRDYFITDEQGHAIAEATSSWLSVNLKTGRAEDPEKAPFVPELYPDESALSEDLELFEPRPDPRLVLTKKASFSDLDLNRHVNNCRYVDWAFDALFIEGQKDKCIRSIQMNYLTQVPLNANVNLVRFSDSAHHAYVFGVNAENPDVVHFQARIGFSG